IRLDSHIAGYPRTSISPFIDQNAVTKQYTHDMDTAGASHHTNQATSSIRTKGHLELDRIVI
ncbi:MAG TPA: hypothetical protein ACQGQU_07825, partial [Xylella fastidiosa subsp. multiplex]